MGACILARWGSTLANALAWLITSLVALGIAAIIAWVTGGWAGFGVFAFVLLALLVLILLAALIIDVILCLTGAGPPPAPPPTSGSGLTAELDCSTARQRLADAKADLARLRAEVDAQALKVQAAAQALVAARTGVTAAVAGLAGSFFFPWAIPAAVAAMIAATYMAVNAARQMEAETEKLRRLAEQLADAQRDVSMYEGVVSQACRTTVIPTPPVAGITTTALTLVIGAHAMRSR